MKYLKRVVTAATLGIIATLAIQGTASAQTLPGTYTTSWIGNTDGTLPTHIQQDMFSMYVAPDGTCYTDCLWEEGATEIGIYKNGAFVNRFQDTAGYNGGTAGVCTNGTYFFSSTDGDNGVGRYTTAFQHSTFSGGAVDGSVLEVATAGVTGLACNGTELYVSDSVNNVVHVYNTDSMTQLRSWALTNPGRIAIGSSGSLWIIVGTAIKHYDKNGNYLGQQITGVTKPTGICIDSTNKLYATDDGPDQNVKIFSSIDTSPTLSTTFGTTGGALSGSGTTIGTVGPLRFVHPQAVGVDSSGNIYVATRHGSQDVGATGSSVLESYTSSGTRKWVLYGLHWTVSGDFDPSSEGDIFTPVGHFVMNYNLTTPGTEWSYQGYTLNEKKYTSDTRPANWTCSTWARRIHGARFLFMGAQNGSPNSIFRFNASTDGEVAIPAGNTPSSNEGCVDSQGNWWDISNGINKYPINSALDGSGNPTWNTAGVVHYGTPTNGSGWTEMDRVVYDAANDRMYISGYTNNNPNSTNDWGRAGKVLQRYDTWSTAPTPHYSGDGIVLSGTRTAVTDTPKGINVAGNYVFSTLYDVHQIDVYDYNSGSYVGSLVPGSNVGGASSVGNVDMEYPTSIFLRSNGEYLILCEDNYAIKTLLYRWKPGTVTEGAYNGPHNIPGTVEAEDYDTGGSGVGYSQSTVGGQTGYRSDNDGAIEANSADSNGYDIGWTASGQWTKYTVVVGTAGTYPVTFRVASPTGQTDGFHLQDSNGNNLSGSINIPNTGGWSTWQTVSANVTLPAGTQVLQVTQDNSGWNLDNMIFASDSGNLITGTEFDDGAGPYGGNQANAAKMALDGNTSTFYDCQSASGGYVGIDAGTATTVTSVKYAPRVGFESRMVGGVFQGSNTSATSGYTTLATITATPTDGLTNSLTVSGGARYRWLRYLGPNSGYCNVAEIQFIDPMGAPMAPTDLAATPETGKVSLSWNAAAGAKSYHVLRNTSNDFTGSVALAVDISGTTYTDTNLVSGKTYYYQVTAVNAKGSSLGSNTVSIVAK